MPKGALRISAFLASTAGFVLATHTAQAVGPTTTTTQPASTGSTSSPPPSGGPRHFLTAQIAPDYEWKFDNNFKDSGKYHPRGDLGQYDPNTSIQGFGLGHDGAANGATTDVGRFHNPQGTFRKEAFTFTFELYPDSCVDTGVIFADGVLKPVARWTFNTQENAITMGQCVSHTDDKGVSTVLGVYLQASFTNKKPDKTFGKVQVTGKLKIKAWNEVQIVYDGPNKVISMFVNGTKSETPTLGLITVPGEGIGGSYPNDVIIGAPKDTIHGFSYGNVDNFRFYSDAYYPVSTANVGAHTGAGTNTSTR